ncbi:MAG: glycosyltransferase family 1 protein [Desulfovibrio sp.]|nr:glycosyltransferase family 1 protein [Desulfovibrio sp.]
MKRLLWLGQPYFARELPRFGWAQVKIHDFYDFRTFTWTEILNIAGFEPDVLIVADKSLPPFVLGMENFPCTTVFYSVDSHIHWWHKFYAQGFDAVLVSLADNMHLFSGPGLDPERIWWSPPFAQEIDQPEPEVQKIWDCLFVGNMNPDLMPKRVRFMDDLSKLVPGLIIRQGDYKKLFAKAKTLINYADAGDLNFRVFEAMGCGGCLVSPRTGHAIDKLFVDGVHFAGYQNDDPADAANKINFLLQNPEAAARIANAGLAEINRHHRARHRAKALSRHLRDLALSGYEISSRKTRAAVIRESCLKMLYLHWAETLQLPDIKKSFICAATGKAI